MGDSIYIRPYIKKLAQNWNVYLDTPWPEIYEDLPVKFVRMPRKLRTQMKNVERQPFSRWTDPPTERMENKRIGYFFSMGFQKCIVRSFEQQFGFAVDWEKWDLPTRRYEWSREELGLPIAVIKATTVRTEWSSQARNPLPEYVNWLADRLMKTHFVVSVADLSPPNEVLVGCPPPCHRAFNRGELVVEKLIELVRRADIIVGGVGWNVPMSIALKTKSFVVLGGRGAHNAPEVITDPAMDLTHIGFAKPKQYCRCSSAQHDCNKVIPDLAEQWQSYCDRVRLTRSPILPGGQSASATIQ